MREKSRISKWWVRGNPASEIGGWNGMGRIAPPKSAPIHLNFKAPVTTGAVDIHKYFFINFSEKIRLDVSS